MLFVMDAAISIHAPLRERLVAQELQPPKLQISIHAPLRERLAEIENELIANMISIHAPLRERRNYRRCG